MLIFTKHSKRRVLFLLQLCLLFSLMQNSQSDFGPCGGLQQRSTKAKPIHDQNDGFFFSFTFSLSIFLSLLLFHFIQHSLCFMCFFSPVLSPPELYYPWPLAPYLPQFGIRRCPVFLGSSGDIRSFQRCKEAPVYRHRMRP